MRNSGSKGAGIAFLVFINIMLIIMIVGSMTTSRISSVIGKYGSDWPEVDVSIDDVSFEYSHSETDDGSTTYYFDLHRIIHYTYNGVEYELNDTKEVSSSNKDYTVELRTGYRDEYTYKINPEHPGSYSKSYSVFDDENAYQTFNRIITLIPVAILVIVDTIAVIKFFKKKRSIFERE